MKKIAIAQMLLAETNVIEFIGEKEDDCYYKANGQLVRIKPGGSVAMKKGDKWKTLEIGVPQDIVDLRDSNTEDFHISLTGWLKDSRKFKEESS